MLPGLLKFDLSNNVIAGTYFDSVLASFP